MVAIRDRTSPASFEPYLGPKFIAAFPAMPCDGRTTTDAFSKGLDRGEGDTLARGRCHVSTKTLDCRQLPLFTMLFIIGVQGTSQTLMVRTECGPNFYVVMETAATPAAAVAA